MKEQIIKGKELLDNLQKLCKELDTERKYQPKKQVPKIQPSIENSKSDNHPTNK
jgi:hypothetical protein